MPVIAGRPAADEPVPAAVVAWAAGRPLLPVWRNELGGLTFRVRPDHFIKWTPLGSGIDLGSEIRRLRWAAAFTPVPPVIEQGADADGSWFVSSALPGESAVADRWLADPERAARAIGHGLRALHDRLPVDGCPFSWSVHERLTQVFSRAGHGNLSPDGWDEGHRQLTVADALERLADPPPVDRLVVCHGDACAPNTLIDSAGEWCAHVDFGALGVADRWADLAVATWSTQWNYGPGWEGVLLDAYGVEPDPERTAYYRLLWDLG
ncbi:MAG: aminoglycoside 3'-phosphotransferase [Nakamurella sp.]